MVDQVREIILLSRAEQALVEANTVDEARGLRDKAAAIAVYVKKAKLGRHMAVEAAALRLRAERRMGQLLRDTNLANAAPGNQYTGPIEHAQLGETPVTLVQLGITKSDSSRTQRIASVAQQAFDDYLASCLTANREPCAAGLFRHAGLGQPSRPRAQVAASTSMTVEFDAELVPAETLFATGYVESPWDPNDDSRLFLSVDDACQLPVGDVFQQEAHLHFWCRPPELLAALDVLEAWGFEYRDTLACPCSSAASGHYWNTGHALLLLGVRGNLPFRRADVDRLEALTCETPEDRRETLMELIEQVSPGPYAFVFGPRDATKEGWTSC